jgi:hypothetical protein
MQQRLSRATVLSIIATGLLSSALYSFSLTPDQQEANH